MEGLCFYSSKYRVTKGFKFNAQPQTGAYSCSGYVGVEHDKAKQLACDRKLWLQMVRRCTENDAGDSGGSQL